jgi:hypothetical protein
MVRRDEMALFRGGMIAEGKQVPEGVLVAALQKLPETFKSYSALTSILIREGGPEGVNDRAADRALQKLRKLGIASFSKGMWTIDRAALTQALQEP